MNNLRLIIGGVLLLGGVWLIPTAAGFVAMVAGAAVTVYGLTESGFKWLPDKEDK